MHNNQADNLNPEDSKKIALHYMETLVEVAREAFLILDADLKVISGNPTFYKIFSVSREQTENKFIYELGNGQWDIPALRSLLEKILPDKKVVKDYEVSHVFETIGEKTMIVNAGQIDAVQFIILAIEDITLKRELERKIAEYTKGLEFKVKERTIELTDRLEELESLNKTMVGRELKMVELKKEIEKLEQLIKNSDSKHVNG